MTTPTYEQFQQQQQKLLDYIKKRLIEDFKLARQYHSMRLPPEHNITDFYTKLIAIVSNFKE